MKKRVRVRFIHRSLDDEGGGEEEDKNNSYNNNKSKLEEKQTKKPCMEEEKIRCILHHFLNDTWPEPTA